jgi:predicted Fe-Mo cluster-binding NifX family protein
MKIAATSTGMDLDCAMDPRFGRCAYLTILDTDSGELDATPNPFLDAAGGAGVQAAQWVLDRDVEVLLTGTCGPKAAAVLRDAGIRVVEGVSGSLREATESFRGASSDRQAPAAQPQGARRGGGVCRGAGGGRGPGGGQGRGAGRGPGAGRGQGGRGRS